MSRVKLVKMSMLQVPCLSTKILLAGQPQILPCRKSFAVEDSSLWRLQASWLIGYFSWEDLAPSEPRPTLSMNGTNQMAGQNLGHFQLWDPTRT